MRLLLRIAMAIGLIPSAAIAQYVFQYDNEIGLYSDPIVTAENAAELSAYIGPQEWVHELYVVCTRPHNTIRDRPMSHIGGFEIRIVLPADALVLGYNAPPGTTYDPIWHHFSCHESSIDVVDQRVTLFSVSLFIIALEPTFIYYATGLKIRDLDDGNSISLLNPVSGDSSLTVFGIYEAVIPVSDTNWSGIHALFK